MLTKGKNGTNILPLKVDANGAIRISEANPTSDNYAFETWTEGPSGGIPDGTYTKILDMDNYTGVGLYVTCTDGSGSCSIKVYGSIQDDSTAADDCDYMDITATTFGLGPTLTESNTPAQLIWNRHSFEVYKYIKIQAVADTSGANDSYFKVHIRRVVL